MAQDNAEGCIVWKLFWSESETEKSVGVHCDWIDAIHKRPIENHHVLYPNQYLTMNNAC